MRVWVHSQAPIPAKMAKFAGIGANHWTCTRIFGTRVQTHWGPVWEHTGLQDTQGRKVRLDLGGGSEADGGEAGGAGAIDIGFVVVGEEAFGSLEAEFVQEAVENGTAGLEEVLLAGDHHAVQEVEHRIHVPHLAEGLGRPVGEAIDRISLFLQADDKFPRTGDFIAHHIHPAVEVQLNLAAPLRELRLKLRYAFREGLAPVHLGVPLHGAHVGKEPVRLFAASEVAVVEVMRIPVHQDPAKVEDYIPYHRY